MSRNDNKKKKDWRVKMMKKKGKGKILENQLI
jgi:hypothetical protein